jgi:hypothetical protein
LPKSILVVKFVRGRTQGVTVEIQTGKDNDWKQAGKFYGSPCASKYHGMAAMARRKFTSEPATWRTMHPSDFIPTSSPQSQHYKFDSSGNVESPFNLEGVSGLMVGSQDK